MGKRYKAVLFDIDGVLTDGKVYSNGTDIELKTVNFKDYDAITSLKNEGYIVGCISGEDNDFSRMISKKVDCSFLGSKTKDSSLKTFMQNYQGICESEIIYIGDGKYDIPVLCRVGLSVCPSDAIESVKNVCNLILNSNGGDGCIAELYSLLSISMRYSKITGSEDEAIHNIINSHIDTATKLMSDRKICECLKLISNEIVKRYKRGGKLYLCGNGGSASDAQHIAAEFVGKFYKEREPLTAMALTSNSSVLTCLGNDYTFDNIFSRQIEAYGNANDILIGITTSGTSSNIIEAFKQAKKGGLLTVLLTGDIGELLPILETTDYVIKVPSKDVPRIQEMHILLGHIVCEIVEESMN